MEHVTWLKQEHGMGHGHANALVAHTLAEDKGGVCAPKGQGSVLLMTEETYSPGGFVHDLSGDLKEALKLDLEARVTWNSGGRGACRRWHDPSRPQRNPGRRVFADRR
jgi:hypothetical protein